jgi:Tfp pilus assembly major pilin PilA
MTLAELVTILAIIGIVTAFTVPRVISWVDRAAVRRSAGEVVAFYDRARLEAMVRGARVRVEFHADSLRAVLEDGSGAVVRVHGEPLRHPYPSEWARCRGSQHQARGAARRRRGIADHVAVGATTVALTLWLPAHDWGRVAGPHGHCGGSGA